MRETTIGLICAALATVVVYAALWIAYIMVRYERSQWWLRLIDPDSYPELPWSEAMREAIQLRLKKRRSQPVAGVAGPAYRIHKKVGSGDVSDVYLASRMGWSKGGGSIGDCRDNRRMQCLLKIPKKRELSSLLAHEHAVLEDLQSGDERDVYGDYFPKPLETYTHEGKLITVRQADFGWVTAAAIRRMYPRGIPPEHIGWMFNRTLEALGYVHDRGLVHGAVLPPHLSFQPNTHGLHLLGWTHAVPIGTPIRIVPKRYKSWYPSACQRREAATPRVDIFLAARSMLWLAGEDLGEAGRLLPYSLHRFLNHCLRRSLTENAWAIHAQFRELLEEEFGPPRFCHLPITGEKDGHYMLV